MCLSTRVVPVGRWAKNVAASSGGCSRAVDRAFVFAVLTSLSALDFAHVAHAQDASVAVSSSGVESEADVRHVEPPPPAERHPALPMIEVHAIAGVPVVTSGVCPPDADCVLGSGFGFGAGLEIRDAAGVGFITSYDFWLIDSGTVFELGTLHAIRGGVRYTIDDASRIHPFLEGSLLLLAFGDTSTIATAGGGLSVGVGAEVELTESVTILSNLGSWLFSLAPFETQGGIRRSADFSIEVAVQLSVGVALTAGPLLASDDTETARE